MTEKEKGIESSVKAVLRQVEEAAKAAGRHPREVTLVAATKTRDAATIRAAIKAGVTVCGENRVQEMQKNLEENAYEGAQLHFIGHLQTNKVKQVVGVASLIHSVDSERLLDEIQRTAQKLGIIQDILLEVNIGREENKGGVLPEELPKLADYAARCPHVRLRGLMCIPPAAAEDDALQGFFAQTHQLFVDTRNKMVDNNSNIDCLSMGMSGDFALAIKEGATMVRVGTALFGPRLPYVAG